MGTLASSEVMNAWGTLNNRGVHQHIPGNLVDHHAPHYSLIKPEPGMERSVSPHGSEHSHYSTSHMSRPYHSPGPMGAHMPMSNPPLPNPFDNFAGLAPGAVHGMPMHQPQPQHQPHQMQMPQQRDAPSGPKNNPCSTCGKGFARRSDLARHERIHSGVRPHVCDYPNCGKMFIQRSALTVHKRTHTGEKPHRCEVCASRFSDSSSLARHRRTHMGQRPYKCPFANCQKTFTRRTTLNRHQNGHRGTVEEAAAATAAALAMPGPKGINQARSEGDHLSSHGSPMTTPSPGHRTMSMSPSMDLAGGMGRHGGDAQYMQPNGSLPMHLRVGSPVSASGATAYSGNPMRPTSHPTGYGPPSTLEPSLDQQPQSGPTSASGSPHMSAVGWQSPSHMASPSSQNGGGYVYTDPAESYGAHQPMNQMFYGAAQMRRPQSAETGLVHMA